jgi:hypothetical protein
MRVRDGEQYGTGSVSDLSNALRIQLLSKLTLFFCKAKFRELSARRYRP